MESELEKEEERELLLQIGWGVEKTHCGYQKFIVLVHSHQ